MLDIEGFKNYLYEEELSPNTIEGYINAVSIYARHFDEITKSNLIQYKQNLINQWKPATVNHHICGILKYCKYKGIDMKLKQIKEPKRTSVENVISAEQYEKLKKGLLNEGNYRWYCMVVLLGKSGMRISEAIRIKKKDILAGKVSMPTKAHRHNGCGAGDQNCDTCTHFRRKESI